MSRENLPLALLNTHLGDLGLESPLYIESENDLFTNEASSAKSAVIFLPKSKGLIDMTLALVSNMVEPGGTIALVGENDAGIKSAKAAFEKNIGPVEHAFVGNHSTLYAGRNKRIAGEKKIADYLSFAEISHGSVTMPIACLPGVFSAGELDPGTNMLLDNIPFDRKAVLDVGCGAGVIGALYKKKYPTAEVTMSDSSMLAVMAAKETLVKNGVAAEVVLSDVFGSVKGSFDLIVTNPPFHKGIGTDYSFIEKFAKGAPAHLNKGGETYVVANAFLPYKEILEKYVGPTDIVADDRKFRVYRSRKA